MSDQEDFDDQEMEVDPSQVSEGDDVSGDLSDADDSGDSDIDAEVQLYEKYAAILTSISSQTYVYDNYVQLVQVAHELNDLDKIRESCELFSLQFPLAPEIWLKWLQIELTIATSEPELQRMHGLLKRALADYFSISVGGLHSQLAMKMPNSQDIWDEILFTYGLDCMEGSTFFKDWRSYYTKYVPESPEKTQKLLDVFTYELSLPLAGIQEAYTEFCEFCDKYNQDVNWEQINESYHKSKDNLYAMLKFEEELVSLEDKEHHKRVTVYSTYIDKCKSFLNDHMVQILYERMVAACCLNASSWNKYVKYLKGRQTQSTEGERWQVFKQAPLDVLNRALRNCTWSADLYIEKMRLSERAGVPKANVTETAQLAFEATSNDVKGHLNVWLEYLSYIKRNTDLSNDKEVELLRKTMELGIETLASRTADAHSEFDQLCARIEYGTLQNGDGGYEHFDNVIKNYNNQNKAILWIEFAHLDFNRGADAARRIYRRAIKVKNIDDFDTVMSLWKTFEYTHGTSAQIQECHYVCDKIIENYNRHVAIKSHKRKPEGENDTKIAEKKQKTTNERPEAKVPKLAEQKKAEAPKPVEQSVEQEFGEKDDTSVFVSNLSYELTKEEIIAAFPELKIKNVTLVMTPAGRSKGYGYVELSNQSEVEKAISFDRRSINGRPVFITKITRDKAVRPAFKYSESKEANKIFIKGLPFDTSKDELQVLFCTFGTIKDIRLVTKKDGKFKGIAFIDFDSEKAANKAVETMDSFELRNFTIAVAISNPPPKSEGPRVTTGIFRPSQLHGMRGAATPRTEAKPRLTFIPTSVQRSAPKPSVSSSSNGTNGDKPLPKSNDYFRQLLNKK